jgi:pyridoxal phosphate enzyme (YggS family)
VSGVAEALAAVEARIARAARAAGRDPAEIRLVAVSKTKPVEAIREAYLAGQRDFGENYAQELAAKADALRDLADLRWHFIGHLQRNKARVVAPLAHVVHTVDSTELAAELGRRATAAGRAPLRVMIEVNVGIEAQKQGVAPEGAADLARVIEASSALRLIGLMTMPPAGDPGATRAVFDRVRKLRDELTTRSRAGFTAGSSSEVLAAGVSPGRQGELSMGMSDDLEIAIACGATIVRIGSAIFGARTL